MDENNNSPLEGNASENNMENEVNWVFVGSSFGDNESFSDDSTPPPNETVSEDKIPPNGPFTGETTPPPMPAKPPKKGAILGKIVAYAVIFGLVAGVIFTGVNHVTKRVSGAYNTGSVASVEIPESSGTQTEISGSIKAVDVSSAVEAVKPAVVSITNITVKQVIDWFGRKTSSQGKSLGSGFIVYQSDTELFIATNNHVVEDATTLTVAFCDESAAEAEVRATDESTDMAVIAVKLSALSSDTLKAIRVCKLGDSSAVKCGETSIVIGNAMGFGISATSGIISALSRTITSESGTYEVLQTDAAINAGNSGGPVINANGEVIGVSNAKCIVSNVEGICYAIPINNAKNVINEAINKKVEEPSSAEANNGGTTNDNGSGKPSSADSSSSSDGVKLGITGVNIGATESKEYNVPEGVYISNITSGSVAEKYGFQIRDVITQFGDEKITSVSQLASLIKQCKSGDSVEITFQRKSGTSYSVNSVIVKF